MQQSIPSYQQRDAHWMHQALLEAKKAAALGEIPVGAVIVRDEQFIARAHNRRELDQDAVHPTGLSCVKQLAAERMHPLCHAGALPDVQRCNHQLPPGSGGIRR